MLTADYLEFCTSEPQRVILRAVIEYGSNAKAAKGIGRNVRTIERALGAIRNNAAQRGFAPAYDLTHPTPPTQILKGTSTLYNGRGEISQQWVKTDRADADQALMLRAASEALKEELPRYKPAATLAKKLPTALHNLYVITDYHFGMLSWGEETGADWDVDIAEQTILDWFAAAIKSSPDADTATFCNLGDFLHWDGLLAITPASGHVLDADTRFQRVVRIVIRVMRRIIAMLLAKHRHVTVIMADANHDPASGVWLREWLAHVYEGEKRVTVDNTADTYYLVRHGQTALFFHHGHKKAIRDVAQVFVAKFRKDYGECLHHYAHGGHLHHDIVHETPLMKSEQHRTLAANDAYGSRAGFVSGRDAKCITYHCDYGEVSRVTISPDMLKGAA